MKYESTTRVLITFEESIGYESWHTYSWMMAENKSGWMTSKDTHRQMLQEVYGDDYEEDYEKEDTPALLTENGRRITVHNVKLIHPLNFGALIEEGILKQ
jgi:hypothetical protein